MKINGKDSYLALLKGEQGEQGIQGIQGIQGEKGEKGDKGDKGDTGAAGKDGAGCYVNGVATSVNFTSDPQTQIDELKSQGGGGGLTLKSEVLTYENFSTRIKEKVLNHKFVKFVLTNNSTGGVNADSRHEVTIKYDGTANTYKANNLSGYEWLIMGNCSQEYYLEYNSTMYGIQTIYFKNGSTNASLYFADENSSGILAFNSQTISVDSTQTKIDKKGWSNEVINPLLYNGKLTITLYYWE